ncbi:translation initiation factor IF-2 subunit beta [Methanosarcinales archaeon]|nr:MAG: translation initiation factor IF-2 subunit beta [Methanosarcinales archaeon]
MSYEEYLERALERLPDIRREDERFVIPKPVVSIEGKTTILENFSSIADTLNRSEEHLMKYLLRELGTAGKIEGGRAIFQGKFQAEDIDEQINSYVEEYVLCSECGKPDTQLVKSDRILMLKCEACGAHRPVKKRKVVIEKMRKGLNKGDEVEVMIVSVGNRGDGIARYQNYTIFVPGAKKGELVKVRIKKVSGTLAFAERI